MKIALVAPPWAVLPAEDNSGIENTIFNLAEAYIQESEEVILFAAAGSASSAQTVSYPPIPDEIDRESIKVRGYIKKILAEYAYLKALTLGADIIHDFTLCGEYEIPVPVLHTVYGPARQETVNICRRASTYPNNFFVAVSNRQRAEFSAVSRDINFAATIYKCIETSKIKFTEKKDDYLLFIGHQEQAQNLELAKRVAAASKKRLIDVMYGSLPENYPDLKPWLSRKTKSTDLRLTDELPKKSRYDLYRHAAATIHISSWEEPFSAEILESLACGTPVIALRKGSVSEVIQDGKTGFLVETEKEMRQAVEKISLIKPADCRKAAEEKFSSKVIAGEYLNLYRTLPKI